ncbi:hypothetical protein OS493_007728 [Desmophyllum pertusum]|uniref:Fibronectin type-III domain-containing protein n=1 Tax=Desmophyllum pertusum TaxID=174260 RepID=A0A9X0CLK5_9CNID|nr:hypothetical protein OS493_007728 [Desmophyllum pertusum]
MSEDCIGNFSNTYLYLTCRCSILIPDRPPKDITAFSLGTNAVQVGWSPVPPGYTNGEVLGYRVLYNDVNDTSRANSTLVSPKETHSKINGLNANTNYSFQVLAFTAKGNGAKSEAYFARTLPDPVKQTPKPDANTGGSHSLAKVNIAVAAVFSGTVALLAVFPGDIFCPKEEDVAKFRQWKSRLSSVAPYAISSPDWIERIVTTNNHGYETLDDDNVPTTIRQPLYINIGADGSLDLPPHLRDIVFEFEKLYENTRYKRLQPYRVQATATAMKEHKQHHSVDLGELRGFIGDLQGDVHSMEMTEMGTVKQRRRPRRFSVDLGQVREFITLRETKTSLKEENTALADQPDAQNASVNHNDTTC